MTRHGVFYEIPPHLAPHPTNLGRLIPIGQSKPTHPGRYLVYRPPLDGSWFAGRPPRVAALPAPRPRQSTVAGASGRRARPAAASIHTPDGLGTDGRKIIHEPIPPPTWTPRLLPLHASVRPWHASPLRRRHQERKNKTLTSPTCDDS